MLIIRTRSESSRRVTPTENGFLELVTLSSKRTWILVTVTSRFLMTFAMSFSTNESCVASFATSAQCSTPFSFALSALPCCRLHNPKARDNNDAGLENTGPKNMQSMRTHFDRLRTKFLLKTFYGFLIRHFKQRKESCFFLKSEKKRKIRILVYWHWP